MIPSDPLAWGRYGNNSSGFVLDKHGNKLLKSVLSNLSPIDFIFLPLLLMFCSTIQPCSTKTVHSVKIQSWIFSNPVANFMRLVAVATSLWPCTCRNDCCSSSSTDPPGCWALWLYLPCMQPPAIQPLNQSSAAHWFNSFIITYTNLFIITILRLLRKENGRGCTLAF